MPDEEYTGTHRAPELPETDRGPDTEPGAPAHPDTPATLTAEPPAAAQPVAAGPDHYLKRWTFLLVVVAVGIPAALVGLGLFYWWYHSVDKAPAVFVVFVYVIVCAVGGLLTAMVERKPLLSALAIALLAAPFISVLAAAPLYGAYYFEWIPRPTLG